MFLKRRNGTDNHFTVRTVILVRSYVPWSLERTSVRFVVFIYYTFRARVYYTSAPSVYAHNSRNGVKRAFRRANAEEHGRICAVDLGLFHFYYLLRSPSRDP